MLETLQVQARGVRTFQGYERQDIEKRKTAVMEKERMRLETHQSWI
jgi:hypothetical protein